MILPARASTQPIASALTPRPKAARASPSPARARRWLFGWFPGVIHACATTYTPFTFMGVGKGEGAGPTSEQTLAGAPRQVA